VVGALRGLGSLPGRGGFAALGSSPDGEHPGKLPEVLVILDGASEPVGAGATSLELARTPALDRLAREGELMRIRTVPPGLAAGSEVAIPALLGWSPTGPVDRGAVEAAARGIPIGRGERAWRVDVVAGAASRPVGVRLAANVPGPQRADDDPGTARANDAETARAIDADTERADDSPGTARATDAETARAARELALAAPEYAVYRLAGHRLLVCGPPPLPAAAGASGLRPWREGIVPPRMLGLDTVVIGAPGAAIGVARLMGARTVVPEGTTGLPDSDLAAKAAAARVAIEAGARLVVVHVGGPDEASHVRDRAAKISSLERTDRELIAPLAEAVRGAGGVLCVGPDHGCDPATGAHDAAPVPWVAWWANSAGALRCSRPDAARCARVITS
jgi:2,3-bisphosphoglycerate-independent phosphoglycerate mutase